MLTTRHRAAAAGLLAAVAVSVTGCSSGGSGNDKIAGVDTEKSGSATPSASAPAEKNAPHFDLPSDITVKVERQPTGDAAKDAVLRDLAYAAQARQEALTQGEGTANFSRYYAADAFVYINQQVAAARNKGLTSTGSYRYYDFRVLDLNGQSASARYCEDQRKAYAKEVKTNKVHRTQPSDNDFIQITVQTAKDSRGDWQVRQVSWKKAVAECVQG